MSVFDLYFLYFDALSFLQDLIAISITQFLLGVHSIVPNGPHLIKNESRTTFCGRS